MGKFHLVQVTTDDRKHQLWATVAETLEQAINNVLAAVPEGWTAKLVPDRLRPNIEATLNLKPGDVREITLRVLPPSLVPEATSE